MDILKSIMPPIAVIIITTSTVIKRKDIKEKFSTRPVLSSILVLIGFIIMLLLVFFAARYVMKMV